MTPLYLFGIVADMKFDAYLVGDITIEAAKDLSESMLSKTPKNLSIFLSSEGGDVNGALTIGSAIQALQRQGKTVHIHCGGCAYSSGVLLLQFADRRTMEPYTSMLIHPATMLPKKGAWLSISELNGLADDLSYAEHCYFEVLQRRSGYDIYDLLNRAHYRRQEILLYPQDCLKWNLIDEILDYALPERKQESRIPSDDGVSNVVQLDVARGPIQATPPINPRKTSRRQR